MEDKEKIYPNCESSVWLRSCEEEIIQPVKGTIEGDSSDILLAFYELKRKFCFLHLLFRNLILCRFFKQIVNNSEFRYEF